MSELKKISNSFEETLKDNDLRGFTINLAETFTDSMLKDGVVKDIPIIGTIIGLGKTVLNIKDRLFLKKIIYFISELSDIPPQTRNKMISKIDNSKEYRVKVGEKLIYIIDKCEDHERAQIIARLFSAFLTSKIDYADFLRAANVIEKTVLEDLYYFVETDDEELSLEEASYFINSGLFDFGDISLRPEQVDWDGETVDTVVSSATITPIGKTIRSILRQQ